jgi:hypothetical protein
MIEEAVYTVATVFKEVKRFSLQRNGDSEPPEYELVFTQTVYQRR